jgi:hypothetical protein
MSAKRSILMLAFVVLLAVAGFFAFKPRFAAQTRDRETNFVTIHFLAAKAAEEDGEGAKDVGELLRSFGDNGSVLLRPFPQGLVYKPNGDSFTLEEPQARSISLLKKDRLIGSDRKWPRWESSGEYARKFPEQQVPGNGYE